MASINDGRLERFTRERKSKRDFFNANGDRLRFRKNYLQLRYLPKNGSEQRLVPVIPPSVGGAWVGALDNGDPVGLLIESRGEESLQVSINNGTPKTFTRGKFFRRSYKSADDETIKFRKNFKLIKFEDSRGEDGELSPGKPENIPTTPIGGSGDIAVLGQWEFTFNGNQQTEEFTFQDSNGLIVRRVGTEVDRQYTRTGANEFSSEFGGTFRFVSDTRAMWISPDRQTAFQLNRKEN
jgi:hypothetical protein